MDTFSKVVQQRNIQKFSEGDHYCNAFFKCAREIVIRFNKHFTFVSANDKIN